MANICKISPLTIEWNGSDVTETNDSGCVSPVNDAASTLTHHHFSFSETEFYVPPKWKKYDLGQLIFFFALFEQEDFKKLKENSGRLATFNDKTKKISAEGMKKSRVHVG